jgi:hypothetical protein
MKEHTSLVRSLYQCQELINQVETDDGEVSEEQLKTIVELHTQSMEKLKSLCGFISAGKQVSSRWFI